MHRRLYTSDDKVYAATCGTSPLLLLVGSTNQDSQEVPDASAEGRSGRKNVRTDFDCVCPSVQR